MISRGLHFSGIFRHLYPCIELHICLGISVCQDMKNTTMRALLRALRHKLDILPSRSRSFPPNAIHKISREHATSALSTDVQGTPSTNYRNYHQEQHPTPATCPRTCDPIHLLLSTSPYPPPPIHHRPHRGPRFRTWFCIIWTISIIGGILLCIAYEVVTSYQLPCQSQSLKIKKRSEIFVWKRGRMPSRFDLRRH